MESTMGVWPQSTSKAKPSTLSTLRISNIGRPVYFGGMTNILPTWHEAVSSPHSSRSFNSFSSTQHTTLWPSTTATLSQKHYSFPSLQQHTTHSANLVHTHLPSSDTDGTPPSHAGRYDDLLPISISADANQILSQEKQKSNHVFFFSVAVNGARFLHR